MIQLTRTSFVATFAIVALLGAALSSIIVFHYTSLHYAAKIGELEKTVENKEAAISSAKTSISNLASYIETQNNAIAALSSSVEAEKSAAAKQVNSLEAKNRLLAKELNDLASKVARPDVDLSGMSPAQIKAEIGECRRAVEINNLAETGELL